uniref:Mevalonate kinase n=1 Tax=Globisporangium ultimum (strain ATCC 200006 / CBS 805.95 / DAOM BR144) TaxID=431595 RepID=K3WEC4_GLOUD
MEAKRVTVSAPAKVLVFGEHAVVYGSSCIAAALTDLRLRVTIDPIPPRESEAARVELVFHGLLSAVDGQTLKRSFAMCELQAIMEEFREDSCYLPRPTPQVMTRIDNVLAAETATDARALCPALFLCAALMRTRTGGSSGSLSIQVSTTKDFPIGAGLGSSAAFSVALAGALAQLPVKQGVNASELSVDAINAYAFAAEVILHGLPSGVDNTVAAFGGALVFKKLPEPSFERIHCNLNQFRFLVVNTRVPRSTKEQVGHVRQLYEADPVTIKQYFHEIDGITNRFMELGQQGKLSETVLAEQIARNHAILNALEVGHPKIEEVVTTCNKYGATTKLTGAGGGGCTLSLLPQSIDDAALSQLVAELQDKQFQCFVSSMGGAGFVVEA